MILLFFFKGPNIGMPGGPGPNMGGPGPNMGMPGQPGPISQSGPVQPQMGGPGIRPEIRDPRMMGEPRMMADPRAMGPRPGMPMPVTSQTGAMPRLPTALLVCKHEFEKRWEYFENKLLVLSLKLNDVVFMYKCCYI